MPLRSRLISLCTPSNTGKQTKFATKSEDSVGKKASVGGDGAVRDKSVVAACEADSRKNSSNSFNLISSQTLLQIHTSIKPTASRRSIIARAEQLYCGEIFRFLAAIVDWEDAPLAGQQQLKTIQAYKIIATFVESGSMFENNMKGTTRDQLVQFKATKKRASQGLFDAVKMELLRDIVSNPALKELVAPGAATCPTPPPPAELAESPETSSLPTGLSPLL